MLNGSRLVYLTLRNQYNVGGEKNAVAALEIAADLSQFCTKLEKTQQDKQQWHNKVKGYCSVTIIRKQFKQKKGLVLNDDSGGTRGISLFNISDPEHLHEHVSQVAIWGKEQNAQKEKILMKIFKGQEDKAPDLRNVRAHEHLHVQMHVRTKSSVRQSPFVLLVILILFYISIFHTSFKNLLLLSFIHFLPWCVPSFHLPFIFPLCWDASVHFLPTAGRSFWTTHGGRT